MKQTLHVAAACDLNYAMPLAVVLASLAANLPTSRSAHVYVLQHKLAATLRRKIEDSVPRDRIRIQWIDINAARLEFLRNTLRSFDTVSVESYYRLLLPETLPAELEKVIYLDSDLVVNQDLSRLWELSFGGTALLATPELAPASKLVSSSAGIRLYKELGLPPDLKFFNSGVMLINLRKWRQERVNLRALIYLDAAFRYLRWHDQEALNAVLAGDWSELDLRWNVTMHVFRSDATSRQFSDLLLDPYIVHFNSARKPWQQDFSLGFRDLFFQYLDKTAWSGWRPDAPSSLAERMKKVLRRAVQKRYHNAATQVQLLRSKTVNWSGVHRSAARIDQNVIANDKPDEIRAFIDVTGPDSSFPRNLAYYHHLGVDRIFLVVGKNHVTEARDLSRTDKNLHVVVNDGDRRNYSHIKMRGLLREYGIGHWCVLSEGNEVLYYPHAESISLRHLCESLEICGFDAMASRILDVMPTGDSNTQQPVDQQANILSAEHPCDWQQLMLMHQECIEVKTVARDPVTERVFPASVLLAPVQDRPGGRFVYRSRVALLKYCSSMGVAEDFRAVGGARFTDVQAALLRNGDGPSDAQSLTRLGGPGKLLEMGLIRSSPELDRLYETLCQS